MNSAPAMRSDALAKCAPSPSDARGCRGRGRPPSGMVLAPRRAGPARVIIDSSSLRATLFRKRDAARNEDAIAQTPNCRMSAVNALEASIVIESRGGMEADDELDAFLGCAGIALAPVLPEHLASARRAWRRFDKGSHPAAPDFGDCFACALAGVAGEPLLFRDDRFVRTDVTAVPLSAEGTDT